MYAYPKTQEGSRYVEIYKLPVPLKVRSTKSPNYMLADHLGVKEYLIPTRCFTLVHSKFLSENFEDNLWE